MKTLKILLTNAPIYNGNKGCVALTYSALYILTDIAKSNDICIDFYLPQSGSLKTGKDSIKINSEKIQFNNIYSLRLNFRNIIKLLTHPKNLIESLRVYFSLDYVLDIGLGDSFADIYGNNRFNTIIKEYKTAKVLRKKIGFLPQTFGPYSSKKNLKKAKKYINYAQFALARDKQSFDVLQQHTSQKNISELIDVAFFLPYVRKEFSKNTTHVGINISGLLWHGGYTRNNQFGFSKEMYRNLTYKIINYFLTLKNVRIHIVPHVMSDKVHIENDYIAGKMIVDEYNNDNVIISPFFFTPIEAKSYISGLDFFIGARMHACIAAFSSGVPVFPLAYSRKFNGLFGDTLQYKYYGDLVNETEEDIMKKLIDSYANKTILYDSIQSSLTGVVQERNDICKTQLKTFLLL